MVFSLYFSCISIIESPMEMHLTMIPLVLFIAFCYVKSIKGFSSDHSSG